MMGRADVLLRFLQLANMDRPKDLDTYTEDLDTSPDAPPLVTQVADKILQQRPDLFEMYRQAWEELHQSNPYAPLVHEEPNVDVALAFTSFMREWIELERVLSVALKGTELELRVPVSSVSRQAIGAMRQADVISAEEGVTLNRLRNVRNEIVHGRRVPDAETLRMAAEELKSLRGSVEQRLAVGP